MPFSASIRRISWQLATPHGATNMKLSCLWEVKYVMGFNGSETVLPPTSIAVYASGKNGSSKVLFNWKYVGKSIPSNASISAIIFPPKYSTSIFQSPFSWENLPNTLIFPIHPTIPHALPEMPWVSRPKRVVERSTPLLGLADLNQNSRIRWSDTGPGPAVSFKGEWDPINTH